MKISRVVGTVKPNLCQCYLIINVNFIFQAMSSSDAKPKRNIPTWLSQILEQDKALTKKAFDAFDSKFGYKKYQSHMKALEISCHGLIWLVACVALLYFGFSSYLWMNMLVLQVLDIVLIATIKAFVRRQRPALNQDDMFFTRGPDKFSFPSGHASRGFAVAFFFSCLYPLGAVVNAPIAVWALLVAISRVCLARHHILDVVGGLFVALLEYSIMTLIWLSEERAQQWANVFANTEDPWSSG